MYSFTFTVLSMNVQMLLLLKTFGVIVQNSETAKFQFFFPLFLQSLLIFVIHHLGSIIVVTSENPCFFRIYCLFEPQSY